MKANGPEISIVILSFNTKDLLQDCIESLKKVKNEVQFEIIVSDNRSDDGSVEMIKKFYPDVVLIENEVNLGFAAGNNRAKNKVRGKYVLFLNSDTKIFPNVLKKSLTYIDSHEDIGALSCKLVLPSGNLDKDARRRFPTPWIAFKRLFLKMTRDYWYLDIDPEKTQSVDSIQGAFFLTNKEILDRVGWFDEDYFLDGEDIDLCWKIKELGYKIVYYPEVKILHIKKASKIKAKIKSRSSGVRAMELFYKKRLWNKYPLAVNYLVILGIKLIYFTRYIRARISI